MDKIIKEVEKLSDTDDCDPEYEHEIKEIMKEYGVNEAQADSILTYRYGGGVRVVHSDEEAIPAWDRAIKKAQEMEDA